MFKINSSYSWFVVDPTEKKDIRCAECQYGVICHHLSLQEAGNIKTTFADETEPETIALFFKAMAFLK